MGRRKNCSLLSFFLLSFSRCFIWSLFFSPFSTFHFLRVSSLTLGACVRAYRERGKFRQSALYLRTASTSNGFDVLSDATRVPVPRGVRVHTYAHMRARACMGRFLMRARASSVCIHRRVHILIPRRTIRHGGKTRKDSTHTRTYVHIHTRTSRTGVNYASREMSNCSPYHKIYNSARCGKHYVLSPDPPLLYPGRSTFSHPVSPPSTLP